MDFEKVIEDWANLHPRATLKTHYNDGHGTKFIIIEMSVDESRIAGAYLVANKFEDIDKYYLMDLLDVMYHGGLLKELD